MPIITLTTPIGILNIGYEQEKLTTIHFATGQSASSPISLNAVAGLPAYSKHIIQEIKRYFTNPHHSFNLDFQVQGTPFQQRVWAALQRISSGTTASYQSLAQQLKTSPRAIGNACRTNPLILLIPCHRVVAKQGLGGFNGKTSGKMLEAKKWLLHHEGLIMEPEQANHNFN